jgi:hypothetical protein
LGRLRDTGDIGRNIGLGDLGSDGAVIDFAGVIDLVRGDLADLGTTVATCIRAWAVDAGVAVLARRR